MLAITDCPGQGIIYLCYTGLSPHISGNSYKAIMGNTK